MFQLVKGAFIPNISGLREEYKIEYIITEMRVIAEFITNLRTSKEYRTL